MTAYDILLKFATPHPAFKTDVKIELKTYINERVKPGYDGGWCCIEINGKGGFRYDFEFKSGNVKEREKEEANAWQNILIRMLMDAVMYYPANRKKEWDDMVEVGHPLTKTETK